MSIDLDAAIRLAESCEEGVDLCTAVPALASIVRDLVARVRELEDELDLRKAESLVPRGEAMDAFIATPTPQQDGERE